MDKFYGYGIVDKEGVPLRGMSYRYQSEAIRACDDLGKGVFGNWAPYRVVELFCKDSNE